MWRKRRPNSRSVQSNQNLLGECDKDFLFSINFTFLLKLLHSALSLLIICSNKLDVYNHYGLLSETFLNYKSLINIRKLNKREKKKKINQTYFNLNFYYRWKAGKFNKIFDHTVCVSRLK